MSKDKMLKEYEKGKKRREGRLTGGCIARRIVLCFFTFLILIVLAAYLLLYVVARGPSETVRNMLVLSAKQASATKWVPSLFLDEATIEEIMEDSKRVTVDVMSAAEYAEIHGHGAKGETPGGERDEWEGAVDGVQLLTDSGDTYKAYILLVKDPSRVFVGTSTDNFASATVGARIYEIAEKYDAFGVVNAGEFADPGGNGSGAQPIGLTYSQGVCVWPQEAYRTFIGFDKNDRLICREGMSKWEADEAGVRDSVMFQNGNVLISTGDDGNISFYYASGNTGTAQRTAIGQRADGTVIFIVTDGRAASSLGATHNDMIDMMVKYGAVNAAMLDGGSSAMMYVENYYNLYDEFRDTARDEYQERGLVNKYKAFTRPRTMPTYFVIGKAGDAK